jgi:anti-anti-sigma regulatory factor
MLKISILDSTGLRLLILEGSLRAPWIDELSRAWTSAHADLQNRKLIVDLKNVTAISQDGENVLLRLMSEGAKFRSRGVLTRHVLRELARRNRKNAAKNRDVLRTPPQERKTPT